jgi:hypothetical protein
MIIRQYMAQARQLAEPPKPEEEARFRLQVLTDKKWVKTLQRLYEECIEDDDMSHWPTFLGDVDNLLIQVRGEERKKENDHDPVDPEEDMVDDEDDSDNDDEDDSEDDEEKSSLEEAALKPKDAFLASFMTLMKSRPAQALADAYVSGDKKAFQSAWKYVTMSLFQDCGRRGKPKRSYGKGFSVKAFAESMRMASEEKK